jgi:hypothetical protein
MKIMSISLWLFIIIAPLFGQETQKANEDIFSQRIDLLREELIQSFDHFKHYRLNNFSQKWWSKELTINGRSFSRDKLFPSFLKQAKIITPDFACMTDLGLKSACQYYNEQGQVIIHIQSLEWALKSDNDLKILLVHEVGHALNDPDHGRLALIGHDYVQASQNFQNSLLQKKDEEKSSLSSHYNIATVEAGTSPHFTDFDPSGTIQSRLITFDHLTSAPSFFSAGALTIHSGKIKINSDLDYQVRLAAFYNFIANISSYNSKDTGLAVSLLGPSFGLGVNRIVKDDIDILQIMIAHITYRGSYHLSDNDTVYLDLHAGVVPPLATGFFDLWPYNLGGDFTYLHQFSSLPFALGIQYRTELTNHKSSIQESREKISEHELRALVHLDLQLTSLLFFFGGSLNTYNQKEENTLNTGLQFRF